MMADIKSFLNSKLLTCSKIVGSPRYSWYNSCNDDVNELFKIISKLTDKVCVEDDNKSYVSCMLKNNSNDTVDMWFKDERSLIILYRHSNQSSVYPNRKIQYTELLTVKNLFL